MSESDSDVVRWGLNFLDADPLFNSHYGDNNQGEVYVYHQWHYGYNNTDTGCSNVENDEIIAHALQEEFSQLTISEEQPLQVSSDTPTDWNYYSGYGDMGPSSSSSSPEKSYGGEEYYHNLEITDESPLDGEVCMRLNQLIPVPHVPRINGDIPSTDEETSDYQRLVDRLHLYDLVEHKVQGDGNCQFRALSDQFYLTPDHHKFVRQQVVNQLKSHRDMYEGYVPMDYGDYLKKMSKSGEWGDHVTLQAAADSYVIIVLQYGVKIFVVTSFKDTCSIEILPKSQKSKKVIFLSFWAEVHYNSILPQGGD
ncbi:hypothetical protein RHGRI_007218 [Rhododendron griersonianum]|uniref:ubiquitinyl hydrolase 1 n=1 Tax=Rhododendron griersonianum TaxID=479676 RepID=A0AAV6KW27_9ERIC|nr:hypothetical protein RHGRI_007218 [Rhododendron griersonianum]